MRREVLEDLGLDNLQVMGMTTRQIMEQGNLGLTNQSVQGHMT